MVGMRVYLGQCRPEGDFLIPEKNFKLVGTIYGTLAFESKGTIVLRENMLELTATISCERPYAPYQPSCVPPFMQGDHVRLMYDPKTREVVMEPCKETHHDAQNWCPQPVFW